MELQNQMDKDWSRYFHNEHSIEFNTDEDNNLSFTDLQCSPVRMDGNSNPYCNFRMHSYSGSFAMDARIRLETLKSGSSSPVSPTVNGSMYCYNSSEDIWDIELNVLSALDTVDLINIEEEEEHDEESWLYVSPKKHAFVEKTEPVLSWCRHVLDKRSPEMEAACHWFINKLNRRLTGHNRNIMSLPQTGPLFLNLPMNQTSASSHISSHSFDFNDFNMAPVSSYRLQNITDVYDMARLQEASLRQNHVCTPGSSESPLTHPSNSNTTTINTYNITERKRTGASLCRSLETVSQAPATGQSGQSPKLSRLHQFKILKRAQNQGSSSRSSSPMRTSLRSLQAVRSSRSLDIDDYNLDQILHVQPGMSSAKTGSSCRSSSQSNHFLDSAVPAIKRCQRSHSLSPCRVPHPSNAPLGCGFASPERSRAAVRLRNVRHPQK